MSQLLANLMMNLLMIYKHLLIEVNYNLVSLIYIHIFY